MNLMHFTKKQKHYLVVGGVVAVVLLAAAVFGIKFSLSSIAKARVELEELTGKIENADRALLKGRKGETEFIETIKELEGYLLKIPPDQNYYSWATEIVYGMAREVDLAVDSATEINRGIPEADKKSEGGLESYSLRITAHGRYSTVKQFLRLVDQRFPLVRVTGLEITEGSKPDVHDVQLFIQWPFDLGYVTEGWDSVSDRKRPSEPAVHPVVVAEKTKPALIPTPPAPRLKPMPKPEPSPEPTKPVVREVKPEEPPVQVVRQEPEPRPPLVELSAPVEPVVHKRAPQKKPAPKVAVLPVEESPSEVLSVPQPAPLPVAEKKPTKPSKSANRLESLLRQAAE